MSPYQAVTSDVGADADRDLIRSVVSGSGDALARLYDRHASAAFGLARRILERSEDAEEVVQDVFAQVWREAARYESARASVAGWIIMLARTRAIDRLRSRRARPDQTAPVEPDAAQGLTSADQSPEQVTIAADDVRGVREALGVLPEAERSLVECAYYEGLTHTEIAARTGIPLGTVKTRLRSAMARLRSALSKS